jgi:hypothetical protein
VIVIVAICLVAVGLVAVGGGRWMLNTDVHEARKTVKGNHKRIQSFISFIS